MVLREGWFFEAAAVVLPMNDLATRRTKVRLIP
jgi:hypothetical protein